MSTDTLPQQTEQVKQETVYMLVHDSTRRPVVGFYTYQEALRACGRDFHVEKLEMVVHTVKGVAR